MPGALNVVLRDADPADDAAACAAIYAPYVRDTAISFETEPPDAAELQRRIAETQRTHPWLVALADERVVGYAYAHPFRERAAYRFACEVSVYVDAGIRGCGVGRTLYDALLGRLRAAGLRTACAGVTMPNDASVALHTSMGFTAVGTYRRVGWKNGSWHDVAWFQKSLCDDPDAPPADAAR